MGSSGLMSTLYTTVQYRMYAARKLENKKQQGRLWQEHEVFLVPSVTVFLRLVSMPCTIHTLISQISFLMLAKNTLTTSFRCWKGTTL